VLEIVKESSDELQVTDMPVPATIVKVSLPLSATSVGSPVTAILAKELELGPPPSAVEFTVIESVASSVVIVILEPATRFSVSETESATKVSCPSTAILWKLLFAGILKVVEDVITSHTDPLYIHEVPADV
jgi:hypothetical protein